MTDMKQPSGLLVKAPPTDMLQDQIEERDSALTSDVGGGMSEDADTTDATDSAAKNDDPSTVHAGDENHPHCTAVNHPKFQNE